MPIPARDEDEAQFTYFLREYLIPGLVFFFMIRWLLGNVAVPMIKNALVPQKVKRNVAQDNDLLDAKQDDEEGSPSPSQVNEPLKENTKKR